MKRSTERILTTHVGSLPRSETLSALMAAKLAGQRVDEHEYRSAAHSAVAEVVTRQASIGIDVVNDGEQSKIGFVAYVHSRLAGCELTPMRPGENSFDGSREYLTFPEFYTSVRGPGGRAPRMACTGPISYAGHSEVRADLDNLRSALDAAEVEEAFVPAPGPATVENWIQNCYYSDENEYLTTLADAMREEYRAIVNAGFLVQIDDPRLVMRHTLDPDASVAECLRWAEKRVDLLNYALRDIPPEKVRFHTCYGINMGPRTTDLELKHILDLMLRIDATGYSFEAANPRHEHEWQLWTGVRLPEEKILIPGVISHTTVLVEHPELVAQRIVRFAEAVGREHVIAGADCGFATNPGGVPEVHPTIVWAKLRNLAEGAQLANDTLWRS
ncbi:MAG: hypothetical protein ACRDPK_06270 [Carbonactinosporaceae bacterium]